MTVISISEQTGLASVQLEALNPDSNQSQTRYSHVVQVPISRLVSSQTQVMLPFICFKTEMYALEFQGNFVVEYLLFFILRPLCKS